MLTEEEVARSWRLLFKGVELSRPSLDRAAALLDELRPESPLRHRLAAELEELNQRLAPEKKRARRPARKLQKV